jgi:hypothetical protein
LVALQLGDVVSDWQRSTEECTYGDLAPEVLSSIADYAEKHQLGDVGADATFCAVTMSERKKLFGTRSQTTSIVVTPEPLLWTLSEGGGATTIAARRSEVEISEFASELVDDTGLEVFGFVPLGAAERGTAFIGLGSEPAARRLRETLAQAL